MLEVHKQQHNCLFHGLMQERCNSIVNALELRLSCTNSSSYSQNEDARCHSEFRHGWHLATRLLVACLSHIYIMHHRQYVAQQHNHTAGNSRKNLELFVLFVLFMIMSWYRCIFSQIFWPFVWGIHTNNKETITDVHYWPFVLGIHQQPLDS